MNKKCHASILLCCITLLDPVLFVPRYQYAYVYVCMWLVS